MTQESCSCRLEEVNGALALDIIAAEILTEVVQQMRNHQSRSGVLYSCGGIAIMQCHLCTEYFKSSLVPRPPPFLPSFAFTIIHRSGRGAKNGEGLGAFIM